MQRIIKSDKIPAKSLILQDKVEIDYCDSFQIIRNVDDTIDNIVTQTFKVPDWIDYLMRLRNSVVRIFGLRVGDKRDVNISPHYSIGSRAMYFTVINRNDNEIVMAENDRHLNFIVSVMRKSNGINSTVSITTVVKFNNVFGRIYFLFILPFHKLIIKSLLKRLVL